MQNIKTLLLGTIVIMLLSCLTACAQNGVPAYQPESKELYDSIVHMDSLWEDSYNNCKIDVQEALISENLEFYHDRGGLLTSKSQLINALKNNICGKVKRELLKGSIEVYPIKGYGAVEMGYHRFHSINDTGPDSRYARFVHIWHRENGQWKITRVISLHG
jgi:predicted small lipoprotein YifL